MTLFRRMIFASLLLSTAVVAQAQSGYENLRSPQKTDADGKVEVIEFFWYGCPHCFQFEAHIAPWHHDAPDNVEFVRMAPPLNPAWKVHSQAYYAAELMGVLDKFHEPMFNSIHRDRKGMRKPKEIAKLAESLGIDGDEFSKTMKLSLIHI